MMQGQKQTSVADKIKYLNQYYFIRLYFSEEYARYYLESANGVDSNYLESDFVEEIEKEYNSFHVPNIKKETEEYKSEMIGDELRGN